MGFELPLRENFFQSNTTTEIYAKSYCWANVASNKIWFSLFGFWAFGWSLDYIIANENYLASVSNFNLIVPDYGEKRYLLMNRFIGNFTVSKKRMLVFYIYITSYLYVLPFPVQIFSRFNIGIEKQFNTLKKSIFPYKPIITYKFQFPSFSFKSQLNPY